MKDCRETEILLRTIKNFNNKLLWSLNSLEIKIDDSDKTTLLMFEQIEISASDTQTKQF